MVFHIKMKDLFFGFIHNYWTLGIRPKTKDTKWTAKVLGYFANLGEMLGFYTEYEWRKFDLLWFYTYDDRKDGNPYLHIEHENSPSRLDHLLEKIKTSPAPYALAIGYPSTEQDKSHFIKQIEKLHKHLDTEKEVMFILDPWEYSNSETDIINAYVARPRRSELSIYTATRHMASNEVFYATFGRLDVDDAE